LAALSRTPPLTAPPPDRFMVRFLKIIVIVPIALALLAFAFANRQFVTVSFDPFPSGDVPAFSIDLPLFIVLTLTAMLGVVAGGVAVWFAQGRYRRAARRSRAEADHLRAEADAVRARLPAAPAP
jgi:uncharacterized integral membrane protein